MDTLKELEAKMREKGRACYIQRSQAIKIKNWDRAHQLYGEAIAFELSADMLRARQVA